MKRSTIFDKLLISRKINPLMVYIKYSPKNKCWIGNLGAHEHNIGKNKNEVIQNINNGFFDSYYKDYEFYDENGLKTNHWKYINISSYDALNLLELKLRVNKSLLGALLGVSEKTLTNWTKFKLNDSKIPKNFERLIFLYYLIYLIPIEGKYLLNYLNEDITIRNSQLSALDFIFNKPSKDELKELAKIIYQMHLEN